MTSDLVLVLPDTSATEALGTALGEELARWLGADPASSVGIGLVGELGAGKTSLVRGLAQGLGVDDPGAVQSPTYLLVVEHPGPCPLVHVDAYLPGKTRAFLADGGLDYLAECKAVVAVEWADKIAELMPEPTLWIELGPRPAAEGGSDPSHTSGRIARVRDPAGVFPWLQNLRRCSPGIEP